MRSEGVEEPHGSVPFRNVVVHLFNSEELHHRTREDLTPAMSFLALLSIASDNAFHLVNDDTGDVIISLRSDRVIFYSYLCSFYLSTPDAFLLKHSMEKQYKSSGANLCAPRGSNPSPLDVHPTQDVCRIQD